MRNTSESILGKYAIPQKKSEKRSSDNEEKKIPLMAEYEQRYKGIVRSVTEPAPVQTLEEKIKARENKPQLPKPPRRIPVTIGGNRYLLGSDDEMSELRIHRIATLANKMLDEAKSTNQGLTNSKAAILALIDLCDEYLTLQEKNSNLKTELMYYQQQDFINKSAQSVEPTPMEKLADPDLAEELDKEKQTKSHDSKEMASLDSKVKALKESIASKSKSKHKNEKKSDDQGDRSSK